MGGKGECEEDVDLRKKCKTKQKESGACFGNGGGERAGSNGLGGPVSAVRSI